MSNNDSNIAPTDEMPTISVIVPMHNVEWCVPRLIADLKNQTFYDFEVLLIDDASDDKTEDVVIAAIAGDVRFAYHKVEYRRAGLARNFGMGLARGEYLTFVDADDRLHNDYLERLYCPGAEKFGADVCVCRWANVYLQDNSRENGVGKLSLSGTFELADIKHPFQALGVFTWNKLFKHDFVESIGVRFQETSYLNDIFFVYTCLINAKSIFFIDDILYDYYIGSGRSLQDTRGKDPWNWLVVASACRDAIERRWQSNVPENIVRSFNEKVVELFRDAYLTADRTNGIQQELLKRYRIFVEDNKVKSFLTRYAALENWAFMRAGMRWINWAYKGKELTRRRELRRVWVRECLRLVAGVVLSKVVPEK